MPRLLPPHGKHFLRRNAKRRGRPQICWKRKPAGARSMEAFSRFFIGAKSGA